MSCQNEYAFVASAPPGSCFLSFWWSFSCLASTRNRREQFLVERTSRGLHQESARAILGGAGRLAASTRNRLEQFLVEQAGSWPPPGTSENNSWWSRQARGLHQESERAILGGAGRLTASVRNRKLDHVLKFPVIIKGSPDPGATSSRELRILFI